MNLNPFKKKTAPEDSGATLQRVLADARARMDRLSAICSDSYDNSSPQYKTARNLLNFAGEVVQAATFEHARHAVRIAVEDAKDQAEQGIDSCKVALEKKQRELVAAQSSLDKQVSRRQPVTQQLTQLGQAETGNLAKARQDIEVATISGDQAALDKATASMAAAQTRARVAQDQIESLRIQDAALEGEANSLTAEVTELEQQVSQANAALEEASRQPVAIALDHALLGAIDAAADYMAGGGRFDRPVLVSSLAVGASGIVRRLAGEHLKTVQVDFGNCSFLMRALKNRQQNEASLREDPMKLDAGVPRPPAVQEFNSRFQPGSAAYGLEQQEALRRLNS
jgi:hypothetical protein